VTLPTAPTPAADTGQQELPFPPAPVEELLRLFVKAVRAHQLYLPNNPVYKGAIDAVRAGFAPIWAQTDELTLTIAETEVKWLGRTVLTDTGKTQDSLPWTFFKDGIRGITFLTGFEQEELVRLFEILQRVRKASPDEDDLLTMLWQADFSSLRYRYVDLGAEAAPPVADGGNGTTPASPGEVQAAMADRSESSLSGVVNMQDFDATLYFLDEKELEYLKREVDREYGGELRRNVASALFDIFEAQASPAVRDEVCELIELLLLHLLASGQLHSVAYVLSETAIAVQRAVQLTPEQRSRLGRIPERLSAPEPLGQLLQALDEAVELPPQAGLADLFEQLSPAALETIFAWLPRVQNPNVRTLVEQAADRLASGHTMELVRLILSPTKVVASEAVRRAGAMKTPAAVAPLARVLADGEVELRQLAVQSLTAIGSAGALQALEPSIVDADREVRVGAVRTLGAKTYRGMFARLEGVVKGKAIRERDLTEKMAFFEAYGALCGDTGVAYLDGILNGKGMFGRREDAEVRACAAIALGRVGTRKAAEALEKASSEKDVVVRNAVNRARRAGGGTA